MSKDTIGRQELRMRVREILAAGDFKEKQKELFATPRRKTLNALSYYLVSHEELTRWRAVTAYGLLAADLAHEDLEAGRVILQRQIWNLNEESGSYAVGAAAVMAEIMIRHDRLAEEFAHVLVSFITPEGLFLDHEELQKGAVWGIGRLAQKRPELLKDAPPRLLPFLGSRDPELRGLAAWALGRIDVSIGKDRLGNLLKDQASIKIYLDGNMTERRIKDLVEKALGRKSRVGKSLAAF